MEQIDPGRSRAPWYYELGYLILLALVSGWILVVFLRPEPGSVGINQYERSLFLDMVAGKAYRPFVYRTLLPTATRMVSDLTPQQVADAWSNAVRRNFYLTKLFARLKWETSAAYQYFVASLLMLMSFMGFAHWTSRLTLRVCDIGDTYRMRSSLAVVALLGLPAFFSYTAYPYDPPQLFLFTLALYLLASHRFVPFALVFGLCCLNKETAVLLIPVFALTNRRQMAPRQVLAALIGLTAWYLLTRMLVAFAFRGAPGSFAELHLIDHNLRLLVSDWSFSSLAAWLIMATLLFYRWKQKPEFLRVSFVAVLAPLVLLSLFLGYLDEWRGYYEAYPLAFGLAVDTVSKLNSL